MSSTALPFEAASEPDDHSSFDVMPAGQYQVMVTNVENKSTRAGTGMYAKIEFTVCDGHAFAGRKVWANITIANPNAQATAIGKRQLGELSYACGNTQPITDLLQVYGKRCLVDLVVKTSDQYGPGNETKKFHRIDSGGNGLPSTPQGSSGTSSPAKPWEQ